MAAEACTRRAVARVSTRPLAVWAIAYNQRQATGTRKGADVKADKGFCMVTWNCHGAWAPSPLWDYLLELDPDVALLQEVGELPSAARDRYDCILLRAAGGKKGTPLNCSTGPLVRGRIGASFPLGGFSPWMDAELDRYAGNLICRVLHLDAGPVIRAISVYNPAWPIDPERLAGVDTSGVRLAAKPNGEVWLADILWACLKHHSPTTTDVWMVGGDFNTSESFDGAPGFGGNREYLDRMHDLGLAECLRDYQGRLTPTFKNTRGGAIKHQMDHLFVTEALADRLPSCDTGSRERVLESNPPLSDHLLIIAHFRS